MKDILVSYTRQEKDKAIRKLHLSKSHIFNTETAAQPTQWP